MTTATVHETTPRQPIGERVQLARYETPGGERVIYGQRINGHVRITDRPATGTGRYYLIERGLEDDGYAALKALMADYLRQAQLLGDVPMATSVERKHLNRIRQLEGVEALT